MPGDHDVIVVGLGVMGSAATAALARRGAGVLGLDRHRPLHDRGSSHGESRMIRQAYYEDPRYVPTLRRAWEGWEALEERTGERLLRRTGGLMIGPEDGALLRGVRASARAHDLRVEALEAPAVESRFPQFRLPRGHSAILEPRAGYLHAERCVEAFLASARADGAELRFGEAVTGWMTDDDGVKVTTSRADYRADRLVLAAGPWLRELVPDLSLPLEVRRQVQLWFAPVPGGRDGSGSGAGEGRFHPDRFPVFLWEAAPGTLWYGFPEIGAGVKVARHHGGSPCTPGTVDREVGEADVAEVLGLLRAGLPEVAGELLRGSVCLYTNTSDRHFVVDLHPGSDRVVVLSPCSGHGFKFAPAVGEMAAGLALEGCAGGRPGLFSLDRFR